MEELIAQQESCGHVIAKAFTNYKKTPTARRTKGLIMSRLENVKKLWDDYVQQHQQLERLAKNLMKGERERIEYFATDAFDKVEDVYYEYTGMLNDAFAALSGPNIDFSTTSSLLDASLHQHTVQLPKIALPKFSGRYDEWRSFHDLFKSLVHDNPTLSPVQKLYYLKASAVGEVEHLLRQFPVTQASYDNAWAVLLERYNNKRILVNAQIRCLFNLTNVSVESAKSIKTLLDRSTECLFELEALGIATADWYPFLVFLLCQKLPPESLRLWEETLKGSREIPTMKQFKNFLETRFRTLEAINDTAQKGTLADRGGNKTKDKVGSYHMSTLKCAICNEAHTATQCSQFLQADVQARYKLVSKKRLCWNCLSSSHTVNHCPSNNTCRKCGKTHHTLLHKDVNNITRPDTIRYESSSQRTFRAKGTKPTLVHYIQPSDKQVSEASQNRAALNVQPGTREDTQSFALQEVKKKDKVSCKPQRVTAPEQVLLATALVYVKASTGTQHRLRALIDLGSQASFITEAAVRRLQLKKIPTSLKVSGLSKQQTTMQHKVHCSLQACVPPYSNIDLNAYVVPSIGDFLPPYQVPSSIWSHLNDLQLADPNFRIPQKVDLLLGADIYGKIILDGLRRGPQGSPVAQNSHLGWIIFGQLEAENPANISAYNITLTENTEPSLDYYLKKFWELEEVQERPKWSQEDLECERFYQQTHQRLDDGTYMVRLPFKGDITPDLGLSRNKAIHRFYVLEKKLARNPVLAEEYMKCIKEYKELGHMQEVSGQTYSSYYLPHHAVIKESSTTKVRVVFDASAKTTNGKSLNDYMHAGPILQTEICTILLRWRTFKYAITADIEKMYRMIRVHPKDQKYQRLIWRANPNDDLKEYALNRVTFGMTAAPYLAIRTLFQLATDEGQNYPLAASSIKNHFYVDDAITGTDTLEEAFALQQQLRTLLSAGGFNLRKWCSNNAEILQQVPPEHREMQLPLKFSVDKSVKALGIYWHPATDYFSLHYDISNTKQYTKRNVLSDIAKMFDPLGWISPIIVTGKILMQKVWLTGIAWDDPLPLQLQSLWRDFKEDLLHLQNIKIPRWMGTSNQGQNWELHGFADASQHAYSACVYLKTTNENDQSEVHLLCAKSRVAPLKPLSIPRLELSGAYLLSRLIQKARVQLQKPNIPVVLWTDSTIVLSWLKKHPSNFHTFVANRLSGIQEIINASCWRHVSTKDNPADCNSRGIKASILVQHELWWHGPKWLQKEESYWPKTIGTADINEDPKELKKKEIFTTFNAYTNDYLQRFSSWSRLLRVTAYLYRFYHNAKGAKNQRELDFLKPHELQKAKVAVLKWAQSNEFNQEITRLHNKQLISIKSPIITVNPFIDADGLLRVGGR